MGCFQYEKQTDDYRCLGYDAEFEKIPNSHWLYHCWEDFAGPPAGEDEVRPNPNHPVKERYRYLEGVI